MSLHQNDDDRRSILIDADPDRVWAAWAQPEHVRRWFSDDARGNVEPGRELVHTFDGHGVHRYRVLEVDAPNRLVLEGRMMGGDPFRQDARITREDGSTRLELVHSGFGPVDPDDEIAQGIDSGWTMALTVMKHYVETYFGRDKRTVTLFRPAHFDYAALARDWFFTAAGRASWLGSIAQTLDGELTRTEHEVCFRLSDWDGILELKAFGSDPDNRFVGVRTVSWADRSTDPLEADLNRSIDRLLETLD